MMRKNETTQIISIILGAVAITLIFICIIPKLGTVWELPDEVGYLGNAAWISGYDWNQVRSITSYYGYGYSLFLVPLFKMNLTGEQVIRGAYIVNTCFLIGVYVLQIYLMVVLTNKRRYTLFSLLSFAVCMYPNLIANAIKVDCEVLLTFWYLLIASLLYKALRDNKKIDCILLSFVTSFIFYIHTRAIIVVFAVFITLMYNALIKKQVNWKMILRILALLFMFFLILYALKVKIIQSLNYETIFSQESKEEEVGNIITINFIIERLKWILTTENIKAYILSFIAKLFYLFISGFGVIYFTVFSFGKESLSCIKIKNESQNSINSIKFFLLISPFLMIIAQTATGAGMYSNYATFFYNRYYDFLIPILVCYGFIICIQNEISIKKIIYIVFTGIILCVMVLKLSDLLDSPEIHFDSARVSSFAWFIEHCKDYKELILFETSVTIAIIGIYILNINKKLVRYLIVVMIVGLIFKSSLITVDKIEQVHTEAKDDNAIAEYVLENELNNTIYVVEEEYTYPHYYRRIQALIKDKPLHIIWPDMIDDIDTNSFIITYKNSEMSNSFKQKHKMIIEGSVFQLNIK